jgi:predicted transport protein
MVAHKLKGSDAGSAENKDDLVENQYKGKETLRPIYDKLLAEIMKLGDDVELAPKNAYVSIRRKKQFAILQPTTKTRFDLGLNMKGIDPSGKLEPSGSFNAMCSHRVRIETPDEIGDEVIGWVREAYNQAK